VQHTAAYERLAVAAALSRDPLDVKKTLLAHPLIGQYALAEELLERMTIEAARVIVLAVDGGNSKTDLALVAEDGSLIAHARGPLSSPHQLGLEGCIDVLQRLVDEAGLDGRRAEVAQVLLAGIDFPDEEERLYAALTERGWASRVHVGNDTFAVLRAGTESGWGVAITCGAGNQLRRRRP